MARVFGINTSAVAHQVAQALKAAADYDEQGSAVVALLNSSRAGRKRTANLRRSKKAADRRRYDVDVDEG
ncbi:MAG: hypothetical protein V3T05_03500 [Myxococcota bacterium]